MVLALVEKKSDVVAAVPVAFTKVRFCKVEEALTRRLPEVVRPVIEAEFTVSKPLASMVRAAVVEVAVPAIVVVAR